MKRKWELGLKFEGGALSDNMMRAAAAEFLGVTLFVFNGEEKYYSGVVVCA